MGKLFGEGGETEFPVTEFIFATNTTLILSTILHS